MERNIKLSIVVPCYNEASSISRLLAAYDQTIKRDDIEVILVNNGSTDNTSTVLTTLQPKYERFLSVVTVPINRGYGFGILSGLKTAQGEFIGWTHGDLQTPPEDVFKTLNIILASGSDTNLFIKGKRVGRPFYDNIFTIGMSVFETLYFRVFLKDIFGQPNVFHRSFFETWENPPSDFSLDLYAYLKAKQSKKNITRFPVHFLARQYGTSSWNHGLISRCNFIKRNIKFSIKLKSNKDLNGK
jgi:polyisoprenyl-phosphate glycosyltransferase